MRCFVVAGSQKGTKIERMSGAKRERCSEVLLVVGLGSSSVPCAERLNTRTSTVQKEDRGKVDVEGGLCCDLRSMTGNFPSGIGLLKPK